MYFVRGARASLETLRRMLRISGEIVGNLPGNLELCEQGTMASVLNAVKVMRGRSQAFIANWRTTGKDSSCYKRGAYKICENM
jgi:hypothetical protein